MARPTKELRIKQEEFYEMLSQRLPRCLTILDEHLDVKAMRPEQRWAVETIFDKLLPTLVAAPAEQIKSLADALTDITRKHGSVDAVPEPNATAPGIRDVEIVTDGEKRHTPVLATEGGHVDPVTGTWVDARYDD